MINDDTPIGNIRFKILSGDAEEVLQAAEKARAEGWEDLRPIREGVGGYWFLLMGKLKDTTCLSTTSGV